MNQTIHVGLLIYPGVTQLDATGPAQVLSLVPGVQIHLVWKDRAPVATDAGFSLCPTDDLAACPPLDVLCVPGGMGQLPLMNDPQILDFLRRQAESARYVTSVCSGSLLLGAAGLLHGYRSACHWAFRDRLSDFGAIPVAERTVHDRNRISGGGVTAGIDFGLYLAARLAGEAVARSIELILEYDPCPPYGCGTPDKAGAELSAAVAARLRAPLDPASP
ncbi:MAG: DJ-1/PfpI family protein [Xanthomonadales bacterium]|nr:DJ-1/PfpI family protein [Xanthomonadales bacterium]